MPVEETRFMPFGQVVSNEAGRSLTTMTVTGEGRTRLKILRDRFVDQDGYEYALLADGHRVTDLPAVMLEFAGRD